MMPSPLTRILPLLLICFTFFVGCAANIKTQPQPLAFSSGQYSEDIIAILPLGAFNPAYGRQLQETYRRSFFPRWLYGSGEVTVLDDPYEDFSLALYNRLRGYNVFRRVVIVNNREEADALHARYLLTFRINDCYALGQGPNLDFVEWLTFKGHASVDVVIYDLATNSRIAAKNLTTDAYATSMWSTPDVRSYIRRSLLRGQTFHNLIAQIYF